MQKPLVIFAFLLFFLLAQPSKIYASAQVLISSYPSGIVAGQEFNVSFSASGADPLISFYAKALGGASFTDVDTKNGGSWFQQNSAWSNMPVFTANSESTVSGSFSARFDPEISGGLQQFKIRIHNINTEANFDSDVVQVNVFAATPTPSPTPRSTPTPVPPPSSTTVNIPTVIPTPAKTYTPKPTPKPTPQILGEQIIQTPKASVDPTPDFEVPKPNGFPVMGAVLIGLGAVCISAAAYLAVKKQKEDSTGIINE